MIERAWRRVGCAMALFVCAASIGGARATPSVSDTPVKIGKPYTVRGATYKPADDPDYDEVGYASWYGEELSGARTANGERFIPGGITAAHRTLPLPSYVEITAIETGRTILVRINDRGPFTSGKLIDLSRGAAEQLGVDGRSRAPVRVRRVTPSEEERAMLRAGRSVAERPETSGEVLGTLWSRLKPEMGAPTQ